MANAQFYWHNIVEDDTRAGKMLCKGLISDVPNTGDLVHVSELLKSDDALTKEELLKLILNHGSLYVVERAFTYDQAGQALVTIYVAHNGI